MFPGLRSMPEHLTNRPAQTEHEIRRDRRLTDAAANAVCTEIVPGHEENGSACKSAWAPRRTIPAPAPETRRAPDRAPVFGPPASQRDRGWLH